jgi:hypothetical protein
MKMTWIVVGAEERAEFQHTCERRGHAIRAADRTRREHPLFAPRYLPSAIRFYTAPMRTIPLHTDRIPREAERFTAGSEHTLLVMDGDL